ncbi:MAG: endonuclease/exonuclease/phosphatase family protein [Actinomycetota bacterium]|nr:endonuclease/exonuclease/phosphatase family protein [Actinomycetota bacterium]
MVFVAGFLFRPGIKWSLWIIIGGVSLARIILQVSQLGPLSLTVSAVGTILWITSFAYFVSIFKAEDIGLLAGGLICGIGLETAVHGLYGTWDMIWRRDAVSLALATGLLLLQLFLIYRIRVGEQGLNYRGSGRAGFYTFIAFMPFILMQLLKFQNVASLNAYNGKSLEINLLTVLVSNILAYLLVFFGLSSRGRQAITWVSAVVLILSFIALNSPVLYWLQAAIGNIACFWLISVCLARGISTGEKGKSYWHNVASFGLGGILFFILAFIYYGSYDLVLPFQPWLLGMAAALLVAACGAVSVSSLGKVFELKLTTRPVYALIALLVVPLIIFITYTGSSPYRFQKDSVRVMDYNIHQGFNIDGYLDLESIARVIEGSGAEVVALQEVSRGWIINGSADDLWWLARRLGMNYLFMPASDPVWGNAILSHYPLEFKQGGFLPRLGAPLRRSYLLAEANTGPAGNINIMVTHLHHIMDQGDIRQQQVQEVISQWNGLPRTLILGDFNAETGDPEIEMMQEAGLVDSQLDQGKQEQLTWVHYEPYRRIDYIWATPDLKLSNLEVIYSRASDHLPVAVDIRLKY